jgi:hypothetical protein
MFDRSKEFRITDDRQRQRRLCAHGTELLKAMPRVKSVWWMALAMLVV